MARNRKQAAAQSEADRQTLARVLKDFTADERVHETFAGEVDKRYDAFRGVIDMRSQAAGWMSRFHAPYIYQVADTMVANLLDPSPRWRCRARPKLASPDETQRLRRGAQAHEWLLGQQIDTDHFAEKQELFAQQLLVAGLSVYKTYWNFAERDVKVRRQVVDPVHDDFGVHVGYQARSVVDMQRRTLVDDPTCEVVDIRDWFWHQAAVSLDRSKRITHRVWMTFEELKQLERSESNPNGIYENVDELKETRDHSAPLAERDGDLFGADRTKDMIEVLEQWRLEEDGSISVQTVGNRDVLFRSGPNPFWHGQFPFVVCTPTPGRFTIPGIAPVEQIMDLQEALWQLGAARIDNTQLLNNAIVLLAEDVEDPDAFEWAPGAQWVVNRPDQVSLLQVNPLPAEVSIKAEEMLKQDLQNIPGAAPTLLGQVDPSTQTATEVSLSTTLAQRRVAKSKQAVKLANKRVGEQWIELNQQFVTDRRLVEIVGPGGVPDYHAVDPSDLPGEFFIQIDEMDESLIRQERVAESQARFQVALNAAPVFAPLSQAGLTPMLNVKAFLDDLLEAAGITDTDRYYVAQPGPEGLGNPSQPPNPSAQAQGVTAPQAADANSPSHAFSQSPVANLQQMLARTGGPANA